ncbi:MAG TPA: hypothetical protein PKE63_10845 [Lacibacter sp.]|nr:hypothetical protein [Lacibacter sp.]HMO90266.1 hypothetical protein [Lacibacter sp.]HMP87767.1 hypothetical protein [Lacibacter sp.]
MKLNKNILFVLLAMIVVASLYRILPNRPLGFAPQIAMALFAGSLIKNRRYAFALPLLSMFLGDLVFQALFAAGLAPYGGFYSGQLTNYLLFAGLTVMGFFIRHNNAWQIGLGALGGPTAYFLISNFLVWLGGGGYHHPKTFTGLMMTYTDGIPFYTGSLYATAVFCALFFGGYALLRGKQAPALA